MTLSDGELDLLAFRFTTIHSDQLNMRFICRTFAVTRAGVVDECFRIPLRCGSFLREEIARQLKLRINGTTEPELYEWI